MLVCFFTLFLKLCNAILKIFKKYCYFSKLFVGGLSWETTQENLQRYFGRYGEVIDCVVMKNSESGRSRGFGFVTFSDPANVSLVLQNGPHQLDGRTVCILFFFSMEVHMLYIFFVNYLYRFTKLIILTNSTFNNVTIIRLR